ncbi:MAG: pyrroline-5-carboxylate reductase, partial [Gammaproteobacteria bacterium]
ADGYDPGLIRVADPDEQQRRLLAERFGITVSSGSTEALAGAEVVVLAVKPQTMKAVAEELAAQLPGPPPLIISIAAGIREQDLERWLGGTPPLVRAMPNTPAMVQCGATALHANERVSRRQRDLAEFVMRAVGLTVWLEDESLMDAVTALSGSGPAYIFLVMEAMERAGCKLGLPQETARLLTLQTTFGAAKLALETAEDSATLRQRVTSPGGTTERALSVLQGGGLEELFEQALKAAHDRAVELARLLGE